MIYECFLFWIAKIDNTFFILLNLFMIMTRDVQNLKFSKTQNSKPKLEPKTKTGYQNPKHQNSKPKTFIFSLEIHFLPVHLTNWVLIPFFCNQ